MKCFLEYKISKHILFFQAIKLALLLTPLFGYQLLLGSYDSFPIPDSLVGFREWKNHQSKMKINLNNINARENIVELELTTISAQEVKISRTPNFSNSTWQPFSSRIKWSLNESSSENSRIRTLYVVFKYYDRINNISLISPILHDSIDLDNYPHKIVRTQNGYMNWTTMELFIGVTTQYEPSSQKYQLKELQEETEKKSLNAIFQNLLNIPIYPNFLIKNYFYDQNDKKDSLKFYLNHLEVVKIVYPSLNEILIEKKLPFFKKDFPETSLSLYRFINPEILQFRNIGIDKETKLNSKITTQNIDALVIDTRGFYLKPTLFLKIIDQKNQVVLDSSFFQSSRIPFIQYIKLPELKFPKSTLVTSAYSVNERDSSIKLIKKYTDIIISEPNNLNMIANGNLYIIVD